MCEKPYVGCTLSSDSQDLAPFYDEHLWKTAPVPDIFLQAEGVFVFGQKSSRALRDRLAARVNAPVYWIQSFPTSDSVSLPVPHFLLEQVRQYGWDVSIREAKLAPRKEDLIEAHQWLAARELKPWNTIVVHPGSGGRRKIWPLRRWWRLLVWLKKACGFEILITLGPAEEYLTEFAAMARARLNARLVQGISTARLAALLSLARLYIGNDSGVSHLAAAVGVPVIVIFGPTRPEIWAPVGANVTVVKSHWVEEEILEMPTGSSAGEEPEREICEVLQRALSNERSNGAPSG